MESGRNSGVHAALGERSGGGTAQTGAEIALGHGNFEKTVATSCAGYEKNQPERFAGMEAPDFLTENQSVKYVCGWSLIAGTRARQGATLQPKGSLAL